MSLSDPYHRDSEGEHGKDQQDESHHTDRDNHHQFIYACIICMKLFSVSVCVYCIIL
jgi:hypothetical protein